MTTEANTKAAPAPVVGPYNDATPAGQFKLLRRLIGTQSPQGLQDMRDLVDWIETLIPKPVTLATDDEIAIASDKFGSDVIQIDNGAHASHGDNGTWVQAWVLILNDEREDNYAEESFWPGDADHAAVRGLPADSE